jgi:hypothetical protein
MDYQYHKFSKTNKKKENMKAKIEFKWLNVTPPKPYASLYLDDKYITSEVADTFDEAERKLLDFARLQVPPPKEYEVQS